MEECTFPIFWGKDREEKVRNDGRSWGWLHGRRSIPTKGNEDKTKTRGEGTSSRGVALKPLNFIFTSGKNYFPHFPPSSSSSSSSSSNFGGTLVIPAALNELFFRRNRRRINNSLNNKIQEG